MTRVVFNVAEDSANGVRYSSGSVVYRAAKKRVKDDVIVLAKSVTKTFSGEPFSIEMEPTGLGQAWAITVRLENGEVDDSWYKVPDVEEVLFSDLVKVDRESLEPDADPDPEWWDMARSTVNSAELSGVDLVLKRSDGKNINVGRVKGFDGAAGKPGAKGDKGDPGVQGAPGAKGDKGDTGAQGAPGVKGDKGDKGDTGDKGATGATGAQGAPGAKGDKGDTGAPGAPGAKGDKGDPGVQGATGANGDKGDPGEGVAVGGSTNAVLAKSSATDFATKWVNSTAANTNSTLVLRDSGGRASFSDPTSDLNAANKRYVDSYKIPLGFRHLHLLANQTIPNAVYTSIINVTGGVGDNPADAAGLISVNGGIATITRSGNYLISGSVVYLANTTGIRYCAFKVNGSIFKTFNAATPTGSTAVNYTLSLRLDAGSTIEFMAYQNSGADLNIVSGASETRWTVSES